MKFIHIADVHLGVQPDRGRRWSDLRAREVNAAFDKIIDICNEKQVELLLIAGDLFHTPPGLKELTELDYKLSKLQGTKTVIIAGNHDYMAPGSVMEQYQFQAPAIYLPATKMGRVFVKDLNTYVVGRSYNRQEIKEPIYDDAKPYKEGAINILLAHGGDVNHAPFNKQQLLDAGFDYIALGHIHKPAMLEQDKMAYVGSLEPIDHTDVGDRGYIYGEIQDGKCHISWHQLNVRNYVNLSLKLKESYTHGQIIDAISGEIEKLGAGHMYNIILRGEKNPNHDMDLEELMQRYYISSVEDRTHVKADMERVTKEHEDDLIGQFIKTLNVKEDVLSKRALEYGVQALLETTYEE